MAIPTWNGKAETLDDCAIAVELFTLGSSKEVRPLLGPRLVAALPQGSPQQRFALRLPRESGMDLDGAPLEPKTIATADGPNNLIEAFRREPGTQVVSHIGEKTDAYFYAGPGRSALTRRLGQSMAQWIETEVEAYDQLQRAYELLVQDVGDILPSAVRGVLLWRNNNLDPTEGTVVSSTIKGDWKLENVRRRLRDAWAENDMAVRDKTKLNNHRAAHYTDEALGQINDEQGSDLELPPDEYAHAEEEDVAALEEHEALAAQEADAANRTWEQARKLLCDAS
ncbi:unnamed protein product, partial [Prorocentrum cordatum]